MKKLFNKIRFEMADRIKVLHYRSLALLRYGIWEFPCAIGVEIQSACNRKCPYCANGDKGQERRKMSDEMFKKICYRLLDMKWFGDVCFNYINEPLLDKRLPDFVRTLRDTVPTCRPMIFSNGDFLTPELATRLFEAGLKEIVVTRHPPFKTEWDDRLASLAKQFKRIKVREINNSSWLMTWAGRIKLPGLAPYRKCPVITESIHIMADGRVPMCISDSKQENIIGNIQYQSILGMWRSDYFQSLLKQAKSGTPTNPTCVKCYEARLQPA